MSNELVKNGLENWIARIDRGWTIPPDELKRGLTDAIAFISSHDSVRDGALEEANAWLHEFGYHSIAERMVGALKSAPFTRKDGTTSPERGTVEDRRKSAGGNPSVFFRRNYQLNGYGRRSGDRARWTAAPVVECEHDMQAHLHDMTFCKKCRNIFNANGTPATQPAQEAPQLLDDTVRLNYLLDNVEVAKHWFTLLFKGKGSKVDFVNMLDRVITSRDRRQGAK